MRRQAEFPADIQHSNIPWLKFADPAAERLSCLVRSTELILDLDLRIQNDARQARDATDTRAFHPNSLERRFCVRNAS